LTKLTLAFASLAFALVTAASGVTVAHAAPSDADKILAKQAYDRGLEAHKKGDLKKAAEEFNKADTLAPSAVALQAALDAAIDADDVALGAELLERSKREPAPPGLASSITAAHMKFRGRAGRVRVKCPGGSSCLAKLDDRPIEPEKIAWATTGQHTVVVQVDGGDAQTKLIDVNADQVIDVAPSAKKGAEPAVRPAPAPVDNSQPSSGEPVSVKHDVDGGKKLPPIFVYAGIGATILGAGATAFFAIDTSNKHSDFENAGCERANFTNCQDLQEEGESAQRLTNILLVGTGVIAIATVVVGVVLTDWSKPTFSMNAQQNSPRRSGWAASGRGLTLHF